MRKAGIKESHLARIVDVYRGVMFNALARIEEDETGPIGPMSGIKADDKGVRVSLFAATLGISPYLFMREVRQAGFGPGSTDEADRRDTCVQTLDTRMHNPK